MEQSVPDPSKGFLQPFWQLWLIWVACTIALSAAKRYKAGGPRLQANPKSSPGKIPGLRCRLWRRMPWPGSDEYLRKIATCTRPKNVTTRPIWLNFQIESGNVTRWAQNAMILRFKRIRWRSRRRGTWVWPGMEEEQRRRVVCQERASE